MRSFFLSSLLALAAVSAQSTTTASANPACTSATFSINSASDLNTIAGCTNVQGNIVVADTVPQVNFGGITTINGNIQIVKNTSNSDLAATTQITAPSLQSVSGVITLTQLTQLNSLSFPSLTSIGGISYSVLPVLESLGFTGGVTTASSVQITDTQLTSLEGLTLARADTISISNNKYLTQVAMNTLTEVGTSLLISANAQGLAVSFPVLTNCGNLTIQQVGNLSINALANVTGSMGIQANALTFVQANNLTRITGDLAITNNTQLTNITMPKLQTVSGLTIANNTGLQDIAFPALTSVAALTLNGAFSTVELPALKTVAGSVNVQTTATGFTCPISQSLVRSTSFVCKGAAASASTSGTATSGSSNSGSKTSSTPAANAAASSGASSGAMTTTFSFLAGMLGLLTFAL